MGNLLRVIFCIITVAAMLAGGAHAEQRQYCVSCKDPDRTYVCQLETPHASPSDKGLQLYCIIRISKDGGHKSCAIDNQDTTQCAGPVRTYAFDAPVISPQLRDAAQRYRKSRDRDKPEQTLPPQKGGEPETLIEMTGRAANASRKGIKKTGQAVTGAVGATTATVGKAVRGAGKGVTKTVRKVGSTTKKTGSAVGSAAKTAYDCLRSWFRKCGDSQ